MIDVSDIHMIQVITELGSINKAAEALNLSQSTLSKKVSRLEHNIKLELFNRDHIGMVPTEAAKYLLSEATELRAQLSVIERQLALRANHVGGTVNVGVGPIIEQFILPKVLLDFAEQDYKFKISAIAVSADSLLEQLNTGAIDIAVGPFIQEEVPQDFEVRLTTSEDLVVAVRPSHPLSELNQASLEDVINYKVVTPNVPKSMGKQVIALLQGRNFEPDIICEDYGIAKSIVMNSDYATVGPEPLFCQEFRRGDLVKVNFTREVKWHCCCVAKPETLKAPIVKDVVDIFAQYMNTNPA